MRDASEGTLYLVFIALLMFHPETPPVFALDNVDSTLNPTLVTRLVKLVAEAVCDESQSIPTAAKQVFLTTHNPTALDALDLFNPHHRLFVVSRDDKGTEGVKGATLVERIVPKEGFSREDWIRYAGGRNLSAMWMEGMLPKALGTTERG